MQSFLNGGNWNLHQGFIEIETGKGTNALEKRPRLREALDLCRKQNATLLIAVLDRLGRNVHFISGLMETGVPFVSVESPNDSPFVLHVKAAVAEEEARRISERTKMALAAAKARGVVLGQAGRTNLRHNLEKRQDEADAFALKLAAVIRGYQIAGVPQRKIVHELNRLEIKAPRGGRWSLTQLQRVIKRLQERGNALDWS